MKLTCRCLSWNPLKVDDMLSSGWLPISMRTGKEAKRLRDVLPPNEDKYARDRHVW